MRADIGIVGNRIARVSTTPIKVADAKRIIDATGLIVAPGFVDLHAHLEPLLQLPSSKSAMRQGVTLSLGGPDGAGPWPFGTYLDSADHAELGMNVAYLAGHNTIRKQVMGTENRAPTAAELSRMNGMVAQAMREEGVGLHDGVAEALEIGRRANIPVVLTHQKAIGRQGWGKSVDTGHSLMATVQCAIDSPIRP